MNLALSSFPSGLNLVVVVGLMYTVVVLINLIIEPLFIMSDSTMKRALGADRACAPDLDFSSSTSVPTWVHLGVHLSAAKGVT